MPRKPLQIYSLIYYQEPITNSNILIYLNSLREEKKENIDSYFPDDISSCF